MPDEQTFRDDPRDYALEMVEEGLVSPETMLIALLKYLSHDDVREMLSMNGLDPETVNA